MARAFSAGLAAAVGVSVWLTLAAPAASEPGFWERVADPHRERYERLVHEAEAALELARRTGGRGALAEAESRLTEALRLKAQDPHALSVLGDVLSAAGRPAEAVVVLEQARDRSVVPEEEGRCSFLLGVERS